MVSAFEIGLGVVGLLLLVAVVVLMVGVFRSRG